MAQVIKNIFISHRHEDDDGLKEVKRLAAQNGMACRDYSIRSDNPNNAHSEDYIKYQILGPRIQQSSCLVVYVSEATRHSEWVNWEIDYASKQGKRIVGVWARGERDCEAPEALDRHCDAMVGWKGESIVDAITGASNRSFNQDGSERGRRHLPRHSCSA